MVFHGSLPKPGHFYTDAIPVYINGNRGSYPNSPLIRYLGSDRRELWPEDWLHTEYKIEPLYDVPEGTLFFVARENLSPLKEPIAKSGKLCFYAFSSEEEAQTLFNSVRVYLLNPYEVYDED